MREPRTTRATNSMGEDGVVAHVGRSIATIEGAPTAKGVSTPIGRAVRPFSSNYIACTTHV
jgi:hypothetical protein